MRCLAVMVNGLSLQTAIKTVKTKRESVGEKRKNDCLLKEIIKVRTYAFGKIAFYRNTFSRSKSPRRVVATSGTVVFRNIHFGSQITLHNHYGLWHYRSSTVCFCSGCSMERKFILSNELLGGRRQDRLNALSSPLYQQIHLDTTFRFGENYQ